MRKGLSWPSAARRLLVQEPAEAGIRTADLILRMVTVLMTWRSDLRGVEKFGSGPNPTFQRRSTSCPTADRSNSKSSMRFDDADADLSR